MTNPSACFKPKVTIVCGDRIPRSGLFDETAVARPDGIETSNRQSNGIADRNGNARLPRESEKTGSGCHAILGAQHRPPNIGQPKIFARYCSISWGNKVAGDNGRVVGLFTASVIARPL